MTQGHRDEGGWIRESRLNCLEFKVKVVEIFRVENKTGVSVKTTDKVGVFSSSVFTALHNSFTKRDDWAKLDCESWEHPSSKSPRGTSCHSALPPSFKVCYLQRYRPLCLAVLSDIPLWQGSFVIYQKCCPTWFDFFVPCYPGLNFLSLMLIETLS